MTRSSLCLVRIITIFAASCIAAASSATVFPEERAKSLLKEAGFSTDEITDVFDGKLQKRILESSNKREIGMAFALLVKDPPEAIKDTFLSLRLKKKLDPDVQDVGRISETGTLSDFDKLVLDGSLGKKLVKALLNSAPGYELNLSREEIAAFNKLKNEEESSDDQRRRRQVESRLREMLWNRYKSYKEKGLAGGGIAPYARDGGVDYNAGDDLLTSVEWAQLLRQAAPKFFQHLMDYPTNRPEGMEESFSWVTFHVQGKLNVELLHRMGGEEDGTYILSERQYYVMNNYNCLQSVGGAIPLQRGTLILFSSRTSTDGVTGVGGGAKRAIGVRMMGNSWAQILNRYREEEAERSK